MGQCPNLYESMCNRVSYHGKRYCVVMICGKNPTNEIVQCHMRFLKYIHIPTDFKTATLKIVSEYDQEIPQSQTADNPVAPRGRAAQP